MTRPIDLRTLRLAFEQATGMLSGWPDAAAFPFVVRCPGLSRRDLGDHRFRRAYHALRAAAVRLAPCRFTAQAVHADGDRMGYEFRFVRRMDALRFGVCARAVMAGRPSPLAGGGS
jgi:hypothetical protein